MSETSFDRAVEALAEKTSLPPRLSELADRFEKEIKAHDLDETTVRVQYINPLLGFLGWDPLNEEGLPPSDVDVIHEDSILIDGHRKAPDYAFLTNGNRRFFLEAKRPSVNLETVRPRLSATPVRVVGGSSLRFNNRL